MSNITRRRILHISGKRFEYLYKGRWYTLGQLAETSEAIKAGLSSSVLSSRIQLEVHGLIIRWKDLTHILTTPISHDKKFIYGRPRPVNPHRNDFIDTMLLWPIGSMAHKALKMQSKEIS